MKKFWAGFLCVLLCVSCSPVSLALNAEDPSLEITLATQLKQLGLFQGVGENKDGTVNFNLNSKPTRVEAVTMLVRSLGKGAEAEKMPKTHPFSDVPAWADGYISYAYEQQLTKGVSDTKFGASDTATAQMYLTLLLRALGYEEGEDNDFVWSAPWALAAWSGIMPTNVDTEDFLRADVVDVTCAALYANLRGSDTTLHEKLSSVGAFTKAQFDTTFPRDPFVDDRTINAQITKAINEFFPLGLTNDNLYANECHYITEMYEGREEIKIAVLVCYGLNNLSEENHLASSSSCAPWLVTLDAKTLALKSYETPSQLSQKSANWAEDYFSQITMDTRIWIRSDLERICKMEAQIQHKNGAIAYRQPTYEYTLEKATSSVAEVLQTVETDSYTALLGRREDYVMEGKREQGYCVLYLIFKDNIYYSHTHDIFMTRGDTLYYAFGPEEGKLEISDDGDLITYTFYSPDGLYGPGVTHSPDPIEAVTVQFTKDLKNHVERWECIPPTE